MKYVSTACTKDDNICKIIELYANSGIFNIELSGGTRYYENIESDLGKLKKKYGLNYTCHAYFPPPEHDIVINLASCNDDIYIKSINHYKKCIEMMDRLDIKVLSIHAGFFIEIRNEEIGKNINSKIRYPKEKSYERFVSAYQLISELCVKSGIDLFLENNVLSKTNYEHYSNNNIFMMTDYESINMMHKKIDFKLLLDLGHLYVSANTLNNNFSLECKRLEEHTKWLHVSQNDGIVDQHRPLIKNTDILKEYNCLKDQIENVTLESIGNIFEIKKSMDLL